MAVPVSTEQLADREAIKELRTTYCHRIDEQDWEGLRDIFTEDATLDYGEYLGRYEGQAGIREFTAFLDDLLDATSHMATNPKLDIDGDTATGRWYVDAREAFSSGQTGITQGEYRETYRRVDGAWKIADLKLRIQFHIRLEDQEIVDVFRRSESESF